MTSSEPYIKKVSVIGCGLIGLSWAETFLASGYSVDCWDPNAAVANAIDKLKEKYSSSSITFHTNIEEAVVAADFIQESGPESLALKKSLYQRIAQACPAHTIVASSTSTLKASELQQESSLAERIVIGHPFNPPHILSLVEVVGGSKTSEATIQKAMSFYKQLGKQAIRLHTERPGHLANRLQAAVWREAVDAVATGQASVEDVDIAMTSALGPRWAVMGPFKTFELGGGDGGLEHFIEHLGEAFEELWDDAQRPQMTDDLKQQLITETSALTEGKTPKILASERDQKLHAVLNSRDTK